MFIDARQMGTIKTRVERVFTDEDVAGFCYSAKLDEIEKNGFVPHAWPFWGSSGSREGQRTV